jgi:DNA-binding CsgD family transcriptional regulator
VAIADLRLDSNLRHVKRLSSKQIAHELEIAEGTAKNHTLALLRALSATNRAHAVAQGLELGLVLGQITTRTAN